MQISASMRFTPSNREMFEVEGGVLYLKAGAVLDHENATSHSVTVRLDGSDLSQEFTLTVENRLDLRCWRLMRSRYRPRRASSGYGVPSDCSIMRMPPATA